MKYTKYLAGFFLGVSAYTSASAMMDDVEIRLEQLQGSMYVIYGSGGNIGLSVGGDGVYIIDDQFAPLTDRIKDAIKTVSDAPIQYVINTHFHYDHTGGNENLGNDGVVIMAHDRVRERLKEGSVIEAFNHVEPPAPHEALPTITYNDEMSLHLNGEEARIIHMEHAHTDTDSVIHMRGSNVFHMGDIFFNGFFPFIDVSNGGSIDGDIRAVEEILALADDKSIIIPGHGPVTDKAGLAAYLEMLKGARAIVASAKSDGESLESLQAREPLAPFRDKWGARGMAWETSFVGFVYESVE